MLSSFIRLKAIAVAWISNECIPTSGALHLCVLLKMWARTFVVYVEWKWFRNVGTASFLLKSSAWRLTVESGSFKAMLVALSYIRNFSEYSHSLWDLLVLPLPPSSVEEHQTGFAHLCPTGNARGLYVGPAAVAGGWSSRAEVCFACRHFHLCLPALQQLNFSSCMWWGCE